MLTIQQIDEYCLAFQAYIQEYTETHKASWDFQLLFPFLHTVAELLNKTMYSLERTKHDLCFAYEAHKARSLETDPTEDMILGLVFDSDEPSRDAEELAFVRFLVSNTKTK